MTPCGCWYCAAISSAYYCTKRWAGLFTYTEEPGKVLTEAERYLVGIEPKAPSPNGWRPVTDMTTAWPTKDELVRRGVRWVLDVGGDVRELEA